MIIPHLSSLDRKFKYSSLFRVHGAGRDIAIYGMVDGESSEDAMYVCFNYIFSEEAPPHPRPLCPPNFFFFLIPSAPSALSAVFFS